MLVQKKFTLPLLFLLVSIMIAEIHYILIVSFLIVGYAISFLYRSITSDRYITNKPLEKLISSIVIVGIFTPIYFQSYNRLSQMIPWANEKVFEMASFIKINTPAQASYQNLFWAEGAEWLPYLTQRNPDISPWGGEWIGTYEAEYAYKEGFIKCEQDLTCFEGELKAAGRLPDIIIILTSQKELSALLTQSQKWLNVYSNSSFIVWESK
jgi:hypothetical protein